MKKRFGVLRFMASVLKILAIVTAALAVLGGLIIFFLTPASGDTMTGFGFDAAGGILMGLFAAFIIILLGAIKALFLYGFGELLMLLISMEENALKTVNLLEEVIRDDKTK